jgi:hypothetical protein
MTDESTSSNVFADIAGMSIPLVTTGGRLDILATVCGVISGGSVTDGVLFRLTVDGVPVPNGGSSFFANPQPAPGTNLVGNVAILKQIAVIAGPHTVSLQWAVVTGTAQILPSTLNNHASLRVREVP